MAGFDLHTHTVFSDGTTSPEENVRLAVGAGLDGVALTDHDTVQGWERAGAAAAASGLEFIPGVELSAELEGLSVHLLGFWFDPANAELAAEMERLVDERRRRAAEIVARFARLGIDISLDRVGELADGAPIGRPHVAAAVVEAGAAADVGEVFDRWLRDGGPAYVPKYAVDPVRCVQLLTAAGGVAVLAHPGLYGRSETARAGTGLPTRVVEELAAAGLAGIEVDHPDHHPDQRISYRRVAERLGLAVTGGSDFHGDRKDLHVGQATTPESALTALRSRRPGAGPVGSAPLAS